MIRLLFWVVYLSIVCAETNCFARKIQRVKKDLVDQVHNLIITLSQIDSKKKEIEQFPTNSVSLERTQRSKEYPIMMKNITDILNKCTEFIGKYNMIIGIQQDSSTLLKPSLDVMIVTLRELKLSMPTKLENIKWKRIRKLAKCSRDIAKHVMKLAEDVFHILNEDVNAENLVKEHLHHFSNQMRIVEEMKMEILSNGYNLPKQSIKWLEAATGLTNEVYGGALKEQQNINNISLRNKELGPLCEKIYDCMKNCPFEDTISQPIAFMASMHRIEDGTLSESTLKQTAKKETISSEMIMTSSGRVGNGSKKVPSQNYGDAQVPNYPSKDEKKFKSEIIELDDDAQEHQQNTRHEEGDPNDEFPFSGGGGLSTEKKVPSPYYGGAQVPNYQRKDEKKFISEIIELDDDAQEHQQNTRHEEGDPNDEFPFSGEGGLSTEKKVPSPYYGGAQVPNYPSKDENKFISEIIELDDDAQEHQQNTRHEESDPNDEIAFSGEVGLSTEKTPPELCPSITISITGEISEEVSSSSSSQETSILNSDSILDPNREKHSSTSMTEHLMITTKTQKADEIASSGERGLQTEQQNIPKLGSVIPISITGEMSKYMNLRVEVPSSSNSQETSNLNSVFGLDSIKEKYSLELEKQIVTSPLPKHLIVMSTTGTPRAKEWHGAVVVNMIEKNIISLDDELDCPNLVLLFLQRNNQLTYIRPDFFNQMPALRFLDFSETRISALPSSLFKLTNLELLMLRSCVCLESLSGEVENLTKLKGLDLSGTNLYEVPQELGKVKGLRLLHLQLYHPDYRSGYAGLPENLIPSDTINTLQALESLSIVVHPEDQRWKDIVGDIINQVGNLDKLSYLQFYFPTVEVLKNFTANSRSWENLSRFNFIVGADVKRIISRVPSDVESKYNENNRCLRFVNVNKVDEVMKKTLKLATAFYLDHHIEAKSLSDFGISNCKEIRFCVVRECPKLEFFITGDEQSNESAFPNLEYLGLHYLWELKQIWKDSVPSGSFKPLSYLMVANCQKLEYIATHSILKCLSCLTTFIIEDCESLKYIVEDNEKAAYGNKDDALLPRLTKLELRFLPEFEALGNGILIPSEKINVEYCPKLELKAKPQKLGFLNFTKRCQ